MRPEQLAHRLRRRAPASASGRRIAAGLLEALPAEGLAGLLDAWPPSRSAALAGHAPGAATGPASRLVVGACDRPSRGLAPRPTALSASLAHRRPRRSRPRAPRRRGPPGVRRAERLADASPASRRRARGRRPCGPRRPSPAFFALARRGAPLHGGSRTARRPRGSPLPGRGAADGFVREGGGGLGMGWCSLSVGRKRRRPPGGPGGLLSEEIGGVLLSQGTLAQVPSALEGLTSVFGMGTGVTPPLWPPKSVVKGAQPTDGAQLLENSIASTNIIVNPSPRPISTGRLNMLPCVHLRPINVVVYHGPYLVNPVGNLILERASHLDAFSAYPFRRSLTSRALGRTTGTRELRPSRSSRTRDSLPQVSSGCRG